MNAYDFDNTIYDGESIYDFFIFCLKKDIWLIKFFPLVLFRLIQYKLNLLNLDKIYKTAEVIVNSFFEHSKLNYDELIEEFWKINQKKLKKEFLDMLKEEDLIITGCPNFLINYIKEELKVKNIICTDFDLINKKINFICFGKNKVIAFKNKYKNKINKFYTDSLADIPFMKLSNEVYLVNKDSIKKIDKSKYI